MTEDVDNLAKRLTDAGFAKLFSEGPDQLLIESIKSEPDSALRLQRTINNRSISWQARFLASEFLFRYVDLSLHSQCDPTSLQESYFEALRHNYTGNGVDWGFGKGPDEVGVLGLMVTSLGKDLEAFKAGLDDDQVITMTFFWGTPPHFNPPYRVKDFAGLILARAGGWPIDFAGSPADRDRAIDEVKKLLDGSNSK